MNDYDPELCQRLPTDEECQCAASASVGIAIALQDNGSRVRIGDQEVELKPGVADLVLELLGHIGTRNMVSISALPAQVSLMQAAAVLNVDIPIMKNIVASGEVPSTCDGRHTRIPLERLLEYRERRHKRQRKALEELAAMDSASLSET